MDEDLHSSIWVILLSVEFGNSALHGIGSYLLFYLYKNKEKSSKTLFLLNLACSELIWNVIACSREVISMKKRKPHRFITSSLNIALSTGLNYLYILSMLYLTSDRLFHISLHLRYAQYWNIKKTKILILATWCINISLSVVLPTILVPSKYEGKLNFIFNIYMTTFLLTLYLIFAIVTYVVLFRVYARSERRLNSQLKNKKRKFTSFYKIFVNSRFILPVILIGGYLVLTVVPCLIRAFYYCLFPTSLTTMTYLNYYYVLSTRLSFTVDGVIYIFVQKDVRHLLYRKLCFGRLQNRNGQVFPNISIIEMEAASVRKDTLELSANTDASVSVMSLEN